MWAEAYLDQARSDWDARGIVSEGGCPACHELHYLQMATEKLGKAVLLKSGETLENVNTTHKAFVRFLRVAPKNPSLRQTLNLSARQLQAYVNNVLPIADQIERLAPKLACGGPNAEYPWETPHKRIIAPASHGFHLTSALTQPQGRKLLNLVSVILNGFERFFQQTSTS
jgi:hypothetical protein